jgi:DNA-binding transcriptional regulator YhcF (GntR family)
MLPQLADLDGAKLSQEARETFAWARAIADDDKTVEEVAAENDLTVEQLRIRFEKLADEWREQAGLANLPRLTEEEYQALRESIATYGQLVPVLADVEGNVIDGRGRIRACRELGIEPRIERLPADADVDTLKSLALVVNLARRQLTASARRGIVRAEILRFPHHSDRAIAVTIGVSPTTVGAVRQELEDEGQVSRLDTRVGRDGKTQPASKPERESEEREPEELPDGIVDVTLRLTREYAEQLDGGAWLECRAVRLVLVAAGTYTLEVRT